MRHSNLKPPATQHVALFVYVQDGIAAVYSPTGGHHCPRIQVPNGRTHDRETLPHGIVGARQPLCFTICRDRFGDTMAWNLVWKSLRTIANAHAFRLQRPPSPSYIQMGTSAISTAVGRVPGRRLHEPSNSDDASSHLDSSANLHN